MLKKILLTTATLAAVAAPAAHAAETPPGVPANTIEEAGRQINIHSASGDTSEFVKTYLTNDRSRLVVLGADGTSLKREQTTAPKISKTFTVSDDTLRLQAGTSTPYALSLGQEYAYFRQGVDRGCYVKAADDDPALDTYELVDQPQLPCADTPKAKQTVVVDPAREQIVQRVSTQEGSDFKQTESLAYTNTYDRSQRCDLLEMSPHPGAKVVDER